MTDKKKNLITRTVTGILYVAIMVCGFLRVEAMVPLFALITGMTIWEYTSLVNGKRGIYVNRLITTAAGVCLFLGVAAWTFGIASGPGIMVPFLLTIIYMFISELYESPLNAIDDWAYMLLPQLYIALPFSLVNVLAAMDTIFDSMLIMPLSVFVFLWVNDSGAYCCGSLLGRHKLFPSISPGKTWEGSIGGGVAVLVAAIVIAQAIGGNATDTLLWLGLGLVVVVFGTWGDLVESLFKRTLGIKDSGNILPGHGGMLDRFDSSLIAIPAAVIYLYVVGVL